MVFEKLEERLILQGTVEAVTPIHIGSGRGEREIGEVDLPILKGPSGQPYVPGSSLKGKVRAEAERIAREKGMPVCSPPDVRNMCGTTKASQEPDKFCICCRIFGTAGEVSVASKVKLRDAYPTKEVGETLKRTGIAMDRSTGSVAPRNLYLIEAVPAGTHFNLEIVAENLTDEELRLLKAALKSVQDSALGGFTTRGFGKVRFNFSKLSKRTAGYYLGEEKEELLEEKALSKWLEG